MKIDTEVLSCDSGVLHVSFQVIEKEVVITEGDDFLDKPPLLDSEDLEHCNHDGCTMLHATHAAHNPQNKILIRTVDTDAVFLALSLACTPGEIAEMWMSFCRG